MLHFARLIAAALFLMALMPAPSQASQLSRSIVCTAIDMTQASDPVKKAVVGRSCVYDGSPDALEFYHFAARREGQVCITRVIMAMRDAKTGHWTDHDRMSVDYMAVAGDGCPEPGSDAYVSAMGLTPAEFAVVYPKAAAMLNEKVLGKDLFFCRGQPKTPSTIGDLSKIPAMLGSPTHFGVHVRSSCVDNQSIGALTFEGEIDRLKFLGYQPYF